MNDVTTVAAAKATRRDVSFTEAVVALRNCAENSDVDAGQPSLHESQWEGDKWWLYDNESKLIAIVARDDEGDVVVNPAA